MFKNRRRNKTNTPSLPPAGSPNPNITDHSMRLSSFVLATVAKSVFLLKLSMFLPEDFCLFLKTVDPRKPHTGCPQTQHQASQNKSKTFHISSSMCHQREEENPHLLGPFFGFIINFCDDSILLIHEVIVNFFKFPGRIGETLELDTICLTTEVGGQSLYTQSYL